MMPPEALRSATTVSSHLRGMTGPGGIFESRGARGPWMYRCQRRTKGHERKEALKKYWISSSTTPTSTTCLVGKLYPAWEDRTIGYMRSTWRAGERVVPQECVELVPDAMHRAHERTLASVTMKDSSSAHEKNQCVSAREERLWIVRCGGGRYQRSRIMCARAQNLRRPECMTTCVHLRTY